MMITSRRSLSCSTENAARFTFAEPCNHCELGTHLLRVADYVCPVGRHDVAAVLCLLEEMPAINISSDAARCLASRLVERAVSVDVLNVFAAPPQDIKSKFVDVEDCDLDAYEMWLANYFGPGDLYLMSWGFEFTDLEPFVLTISSQEARCLAATLLKIAKLVDEENALDPMMRGFLIKESNYAGAL